MYIQAKEKEMMQVIKIGYQGCIGSNSETAAKQFVKTLGLQNVKFIPFVVSKNVVAALVEGCIDYGVMAVSNSVSGEVQETKTALVHGVELCCQLAMSIHHCVFVKSPDAKIKFIASHIQALKQTERTCNRILPDVAFIECADTALAAKMLHNGAYTDDYAVICKKDAGLAYGLHLFAENVEDNKLNTTTFGLFKLK